LHVEVGHQHHAGTVQQRQELLFDRSIETDRRDPKHAIASRIGKSTILLRPTQLATF
jgi:hypothetical protein